MLKVLTPLAALFLYLFVSYGYLVRVTENLSQFIG